MPPDLFWEHMTKIYNGSKADISRTAQNRSLRRWVKQVFSSFIKRQNCNCAEGIEKVLEKIGELQELIEIMAREMHRQGEQGKS